MIYKEAFLQHGPLVIWQNIPQTLLGQYFTQTNIVTLVLTIGLIPLVFGVYVIFRYLFREKNRNIYFITSFGLVLAVALWLKLIALAAGLAFLGIILTLLFAKGLELFVNYLKKTKVPYLKAAFVLFIILFSITSILPSYFFAQQELKNAATSGEIEALEGLPLNQNETVLGTLRQGNLIASFGKKNVMDTHFLLTKDPLQRMQDIQTIYQTPFETKAIELLNQYEVDYIFVSKAVREEYDIISLSFEEDTDCFELIYNKEIKLYKVKCNLQKIS